MKDKEIVYDNPTNDPTYDEWFENQVDKIIAGNVWDKISVPPTGSFSKMAEVERNLKRKKN